MILDDQHQINILCQLAKKNIVYVNSSFNKENENLMDCVEGEVIADFPSGYAIDLQCITISMPESLAQYRLSAWVYLRKE